MTPSGSRRQCARRRRPGLTGAVLVLLVLLVVLSGCTWSAPEPGLFGRGDPGPGPTQVVPSGAARPVVNPDLPVAGEAVWTSGDGLDVQVRIAVHAVRRMAGGTVLDWSVTPLRAPGLQPGDPVPSSLNLGLSRFSEGNANVFLVDFAAGHVYRPLTAPGRTALQRCLCAPLWVAQSHLRLGVTQLLQITYPQLPADLADVDVDVATVPIFWHVPVSPSGTVPQATSPVDLTRPAEVTVGGPRTGVFRYPAGGRQRFVVTVDQVLASSSFTSLQWSIRSVTAGDGLELAGSPPFADARIDPATSYNAVAASGPRLVPAGQPPAAALRVRLVTTRLRGLGGLECLCSDLRLWAAALTDAGRQVSVVTNLPPLPRGVERVDVILPGIPTLRGVPVVAASNGATRSAGPVSRHSGRWTYAVDDPPQGRPVSDWPTPLPADHQLEHEVATVDDLVR